MLIDRRNFEIVVGLRRGKVLGEREQRYGGVSYIYSCICVFISIYNTMNVPIVLYDSCKDVIRIISAVYDYRIRVLCAHVIHMYDLCGELSSRHFWSVLWRVSSCDLFDIGLRTAVSAIMFVCFVCLFVG